MYDNLAVIFYTNQGKASRKCFKDLMFVDKWQKVIPV